MKYAGTYPTPYGIPVAVYEKPDATDGEVLFDAYSAAICADIYDPAERRRFVEAARVAGSLSIADLEAFGGRRLLHVPLPRPICPAYPNIKHGNDLGVPIDLWIAAIMDESRWCDRAGQLIRMIGSNLDQGGGWDRLGITALQLAMQIIVTAGLEHLAEREIDCIEAAAFYALTVHPEWRTAAISWLEPVAATWWRDWVAAREPYRRLVRLCLAAGDDLPSWIDGSTS